MSSSAGSASSEMSGTVGRERPWAMGACVRGVFCGVGAVGSCAEKGMEVDMVNGVRDGGDDGEGWREW